MDENFTLFCAELLCVRGLRLAVRAVPPPAPHEAEAVHDVRGDRGEEEGGLPRHRHHQDTQPAARRRRLARNGNEGVSLLLGITKLVGLMYQHCIASRPIQSMCRDVHEEANWYHIVYIFSCLVFKVFLLPCQRS